jgi:hypothetical protein
MIKINNWQIIKEFPVVLGQYTHRLALGMTGFLLPIQM